MKVKDSGKQPVVATNGSWCDVLLPAIPAAAQVARVHLRYWLERQRWPAESGEDIEYVVNEAVTNAVEHAYPPGVHSATVTVAAEVQALPASERRIRVRVSDQGRWRPAPTDPDGRQQGLRLINGFMDQMTVSKGDGIAGGTQVVLLSPPVPA